MNIKKPVMRLDIVSRTMFDKSSLIRVVKTCDNQIKIDLNNNILGRGCYLKNDSASILKAQKHNLIAKALRCKVDESVYLELINITTNKI